MLFSLDQQIMLMEGFTTSIIHVKSFFENLSMLGIINPFLLSDLFPQLPYIATFYCCIGVVEIPNHTYLLL